jgi:hypothetical protein
MMLLERMDRKTSASLLPESSGFTDRTPCAASAPLF